MFNILSKSLSVIRDNLSVHVFKEYYLRNRKQEQRSCIMLIVSLFLSISCKGKERIFKRIILTPYYIPYEFKHQSFHINIVVTFFFLRGNYVSNSVIFYNFFLLYFLCMKKRTFTVFTLFLFHHRRMYGKQCCWVAVFFLSFVIWYDYH